MNVALPGRLVLVLTLYVSGDIEAQTPAGGLASYAFDRSLALEDSAYTSANVSLGDVNGDGHLDVLLVKGRHWPLQNQLRTGDGMGGFAPAVPLGPGPDRSYSAELADLDGDGDLDIVVSNDSPDPKRVLHNDGRGSFREVQAFGEPEWNTRHVSVADLNRDGHQDVIVANRGGQGGTESFVCFGVTGGLLQEPCAPVYRGSATTITPADIDGDGDLDLVIPHRDGGQSEVRLNDGTGAFPERRVFGPSGAGYRSAAVADFDGDGHRDIAIIAPGSRTGIETPGPDGGSGVIAPPQVGVFYGTASGEFGALTPLAEISPRPYAILAEDINADGRMDLVLGYVGARPVVWFNHGAREFTPVPFGDDEGAVYGFAVADLDGDGVSDIAVARTDARNRIYFGAVRDAVSVSAVQDARAPNIVFVLLDDVRYDDLVDHPFARLPNIQRLANEGVSFDNFFTSAPLCSPSRAVFLTGQYAFRNGIIDNGERAARSHTLVTFPRRLQESGYYTGFFGKWHMGHDDDSARPGFDRWVSFVGQGVYFDPPMNIDGQPAQGEGYMTDILTDSAISFIESSPADRPFLAYVSHKAVHPETFPNYVRSFPAAPQDVDLYGDVTLPRGPGWRAPTTDKPALARPPELQDPRSPVGGLPDEAILGRLRMLSSVDRGLGRLLAALERKGVLDETLLVVTSDQGFFYGEFGLAQERRLAYEASIRIPLLLRYPPLVPAGERRQALASNVDIAPTILDLAAVSSAQVLDGVSLVPVLDDPNARVREALLIEYYSDSVFPRLRNMGYKAIRTERYKYIRYEELNGVDELYDLRADPHELENLLPGRVPGTLVSELGRALDAMLGGSSSPSH